MREIVRGAFTDSVGPQQPASKPAAGSGYNHDWEMKFRAFLRANEAGRNKDQFDRSSGGAALLRGDKVDEVALLGMLKQAAEKQWEFMAEAHSPFMRDGFNWIRVILKELGDETRYNNANARSALDCLDTRITDRGRGTTVYPNQAERGIPFMLQLYTLFAWPVPAEKLEAVRSSIAEAKTLLNGDKPRSIPAHYGTNDKAKAEMFANLEAALTSQWTPMTEGQNDVWAGLENIKHRLGQLAKAYPDDTRAAEALAFCENPENHIPRTLRCVQKVYAVYGWPEPEGASAAVQAKVSARAGQKLRIS
ncbi:MAG: hypothetical protein KGQ41_05645 [Alphaproteobacteria bacterium]|nr:hypothetical protein [Alphaproteobacteria bacterium]